MRNLQRSLLLNCQLRLPRKASKRAAALRMSQMMMINLLLR
uniref:Uncharacterized protein n=1 Tax=Arundo donax TaxID=35708 RepID=A0A0A9EE55_ARUDO